MEMFFNSGYLVQELKWGIEKRKIIESNEN